ncbi:hypothetical protein EsDP_00001937 [Epichloe bromicola]|uniref:Uncharacterized protein n=1 Tax=Epichloe bromicola TaxID=79588 RepID=A0ABQ0CJB2_9HYPO
MIHVLARTFTLTPTPKLTNAVAVTVAVAPRTQPQMRHSQRPALIAAQQQRWRQGGLGEQGQGKKSSGEHGGGGGGGDGPDGRRDGHCNHRGPTYYTYGT